MRLVAEPVALVGHVWRKVTFGRLRAVTLFESQYPLVRPQRGGSPCNWFHAWARNGVREFLTAGTRRNGSSKFGPFARGGQHGGQAGQYHEASQSADQYTGRHAADPRTKTARKPAGKVVPAAGVAAALVVGAAAYGLVAGTGHPQAAQLSTDLALPVSLSSATHAGLSVGGVDSAASAMIAAARTASSAVASTSARQSASRSSKAAKPAVAPSVQPRAPLLPRPRRGRGDRHPVGHRDTDLTRPRSPHRAAARPLQSDIANGNYVLAIGQYLVDNGYSAAAAAGVASCVDGESGANPESEGDGGGGLIGWTPLGSAEPDANIITGDVSADMMTQLADILYYNSERDRSVPGGRAEQPDRPGRGGRLLLAELREAGRDPLDVVPSVAEDVYSELGG